MSTKPTVGMRVLLLNGGSGVTVRWDATVGAVVGDWCGLEVMGHDGKVFFASGIPFRQGISSCHEIAALSCLIPPPTLYCVAHDNPDVCALIGRQGIS